MAEGEKTEPATTKRRQDARDQGDVANSRELPSVLMMGVLLVAALAGPGRELMIGVAAQALDVWSGSEIHPTGIGDFHAVLLHHGKLTGLVLAPFLALIMLSGIVSYLIQNGPMWATKALGLKWSRMNLLKGLKRLIDKNKLFDLAKAPIKIVLVGGAAYYALVDEIAGLYALMDAAVWTSLSEGAEVAVLMVIVAILLLSFISIADIFWVRYRHEEKLKMTKQEVRDERKQRDGDPQMKGRLRQMQREMTRQRMIQDVAQADVVVTNPTHFSVALSYQKTVGAPKVVAKGRGYVALRIREEAKKHGVPIVENKPLAQILHRTVEVGHEIPETLYKAVAEVLAYVYRLRGVGSAAPAAAAGAM